MKTPTPLPVIPGEPRPRRDPESSNPKRKIIGTKGYWIPGLASLAGNDEIE
jgi:hypothetical protein